MKSKTCPECGGKFKPVNAVQVSCSAKCKRERQRKQLRELGDRRKKGWTPAPVPCAVCSNPFTPTNAVAKYCGPGCKTEGLSRAVRRQRERRENARALKDLMKIDKDDGNTNRAPAPPEQDR